MVYTTSSLFLKALSAAGITHVFVNWGSDHPAMLEELQRQRAEGEFSGETSPRVITCPNEMVALSAAQGYTQVTGIPAAVIIHVDVGTQALAGAIHNADRGRVPILIYAGASPFTSRNELKGSRNEWIMWLQDVPDQPAIVRQYMRHTAQIHSGKNVAQVVNRALQIAMSEPKGPVYLWARREVMEEEVSPSLYNSVPLKLAPSISPASLSPIAAVTLTNTLIASVSPLIITSYLGRNPDAVASLVTLSTILAIPVFCTCPSTVNVPFSHPYLLGITYVTPGPATDTFREYLTNADVVIVVDSDIPWVPLRCSPNEKNGARVFIIDGGDPLKTDVAMGSWDMGLHPGVEMICRADAEVALGQLVEGVRENMRSGFSESVTSAIRGRVAERGQQLKNTHDDWIRRLDAAEEAGNSDETTSEVVHFTVPHVMRALLDTISSKAGSVRPLLLNEGISNYGVVWEHARPELPGSFLTSGGSSLGWALGACVGAVLGKRVAGNVAAASGSEDVLPAQKEDLIVTVVGDGSFMFGVPSSAYWIARRYGTPFLTVVLNNGGWKSPKLSMLGVHPNGFGSQSLSGEQLSVGFGFDGQTQTERLCPDYSQIAVAATAGWAWGKKVAVNGKTVKAGLEELKAAFEEAVKVVVEEKRCAVLDCVLEAI